MASHIKTFINQWQRECVSCFLLLYIKVQLLNLWSIYIVS
jgi:hypothetical protein